MCQLSKIYVSHRRILPVTESKCSFETYLRDMNRLKHLSVLSLILVLFNCSSVKNEALYYEDGIANLNGMWVSSTSQEIVLDVDYSKGTLSMTLLGQPIVYQSMTKRKDQVLLTFKDSEDQKYYLVGQLSNKNAMRLSFTKEEVTEILPVGQLGEKVYRLERIKTSKQAIVASRN